MHAGGSSGAAGYPLMRCGAQIGDFGLTPVTVIKNCFCRESSQGLSENKRRWDWLFCLSSFPVSLAIVDQFPARKGPVWCTRAVWCGCHDLLPDRSHVSREKNTIARVRPKKRVAAASASAKHKQEEETRSNLCKSLKEGLFRLERSGAFVL